MATPALGVRATYSKLNGIDDFDLQTAGIDATISKGFLFLTPYAGAGMLWIDGKYNGSAASLSNEVSGSRAVLSVSRSPRCLLSTLLPKRNMRSGRSTH